MLFTNYLISQNLKRKQNEIGELMNGRVKRALELNFNKLANVTFPPWYNVFKVIIQMLFCYDKNNLHVVDVYNRGGSYVNVETGENFRARVTVCRSVIKRDTCVIALLISMSYEFIF
jgi:hypothetical protein